MSSIVSAESPFIDDKSIDSRLQLPQNILSNVFTLGVPVNKPCDPSKLWIPSRVFNDVQNANIWSISLTLSVFNGELIFKSVKFLQPQNILSMFIHSVVSTLSNTISCKFSHRENKLEAFKSLTSLK